MSNTAEELSVEKRGRGRPRKDPIDSIEALLAADDDECADAGDDLGDDDPALSDDDDTEAEVAKPEHLPAPLSVAISAGEERELAFRPDGLPMGEVDPNATGPNGLSWGQRDPCDILSLDAATGYFEWDSLWPAWKAAAHAGLVEALRERAHILFRQRRDIADMQTLGEKQWWVALILALLVKNFAEGGSPQYADPRFDQNLIRARGRRIPTRIRSGWRDFTKFPFRSGTGIKTLFNPNGEEVVLTSLW